MDESGESFNCVIAEVPRLLLPILDGLSRFPDLAGSANQSFGFP